MSVTDETLRLLQQLRVEIADLTDNQTRDIVASWARAWDDIAGDLDSALQDLATAAGDGRITRRALRDSTRLQAALRTLADVLPRLVDETQARISGDVPTAVKLAGTAQHSLITSQLPPEGQSVAVAWRDTDTDAIAALLRRVTGQITSTARPLAPDTDRAVKRELVTGLATGRGPREVARRIMDRTEGAFNGGLTRALTISRTEMLDATRSASKLAQLANADVLQGWVWLAALDRRTCMACIAMNGTEHPLSEDGPLGHPNCRCARVPITLSWADLGFDLTEPQDMTPDAEAFFDDLDPAEQISILGRRGYDAWQAGDFPVSTWATRKANSDWRDSYVPAKAPAA